MPSKLQAALAAVGARLKRHRKHLVYELPDGRNFVTASTPSDRHADANALRQLERMTVPAMPGAPRAITPDRKKRIKPGARSAPWSLPVVSPLAAELSAAGVVEARLRMELAESYTAGADLAAQVRRYREVLDRIYACRVVKGGVWLGVIPERPQGL